MIDQYFPRSLATLAITSLTCHVFAFRLTPPWRPVFVIRNSLDSVIAPFHPFILSTTLIFSPQSSPSQSPLARPAVAGLQQVPVFHRESLT
ncbi:hypothetical protein BDR22DRAFT_181734 [Usnea florida]